MEKNINENNNTDSNMIVNNNEYINENTIMGNMDNMNNMDNMSNMENIDNLKIKTQQDLINEYYQKLQKHKYERFIEITMNQTTYTRDEAMASLEKHKCDITLVIKEFLGVVDKSEEREKEQNSKSLHQKRYGVIREYMDNASMNFRKKQEQSKKYNEFIEKHARVQNIVSDTE
jgi:hypothetical protein